MGEKKDPLMLEIIQPMEIFVHKLGQSQWSIRTIGCGGFFDSYELIIS